MPEQIKNVGQELKMKKPFRSASVEGALSLMRTADVMTRFFESVVEPGGLTLQQYNVLRILRGAEKEGLPTLEVAERMVQRAPGITRMLDRLMAKGLVARERSSRDRRVVYCHITEEGLGVLAALDDSMASADDSALSMLPNDDQRMLIGLLDRIRAGHESQVSPIGRRSNNGRVVRQGVPTM
jgi:DNA-binding MarR family transcriptional regulator